MIRAITAEHHDKKDKRNRFDNAPFAITVFVMSSTAKVELGKDGRDPVLPEFNLTITIINDI